MSRPETLSRTRDKAPLPRAPKKASGTAGASAGPLAVARLIRSTNRGFGQCLQTSLARFGFSSGMWHFLRVLNERRFGERRLPLRSSSSSAWSVRV